MKRFVLAFVFVLCAIIGMAQEQKIVFDDFFYEKGLRLDFHQAGNANDGAFYLHRLKEMKHWGGSLKKLIDTMKYGDYMLEIYDKTSGTMIYSRGFSTLFCEWQETIEANNISKSFETSMPIPFPKKEFIAKINKRDRSNNWLLEFEGTIDPNKAQIVNETTYDFKFKKTHDGGNPNQSLDVAIIAEGYTAAEMDKFHKDVEKYTKVLFNVAPFGEYKSKINIWRIDAVSDSSGTDFPSKGLWRKTILDAHFDTFGSARYLTSQAIFKMHDIADLVPYDQVYILVNTPQYGGGGIYNFYSLTSADHELSPEVFTHEFGHGFGSLGDEYGYDSASNDIEYDFTVEISSPNLTTMVEFDKKWKDMVDKNVPIPTPPTEKYKNVVGVFEGGGYLKEKIYRPVMDCKMRSNNLDEFCPVCQRALIQMLNFYTE